MTHPTASHADASLADLRPGDLLVQMLTAHRRNDYRSAMRCRKALRKTGLSITLGNLDPYVQAGELAFSLDQLVAAMARGEFRLATAHRKGLGKAGVSVVPIVAPSSKGGGA